MAAIALFFSIASLGLPGLGNFVGEFLVLLGTYQVSIIGSAVATLGLVAAAVYSLALMQRTFYGAVEAAQRDRAVPDLSRSVVAMFGVMMIIQVWLGLYPQPVLTMVGSSIEHLRALTAASALVLQR